MCMRALLIFIYFFMNCVHTHSYCGHISMRAPPALVLFVYVLNCVDAHSYCGEAMHVCVDVHVFADVCS